VLAIFSAGEFCLDFVSLGDKGTEVFWNAGTTDKMSHPRRLNSRIPNICHSVCTSIMLASLCSFLHKLLVVVDLMKELFTFMRPEGSLHGSSHIVHQDIISFLFLTVKAKHGHTWLQHSVQHQVCSNTNETIKILSTCMDRPNAKCSLKILTIQSFWSTENQMTDEGVCTASPLCWYSWLYWKKLESLTRYLWAKYAAP
jgi:hypothetical protein